ncbi:MAG: alpha/beta hydrolase, partial [Egibacteraceae bacterium]
VAGVAAAFRTADSGVGPVALDDGRIAARLRADGVWDGPRAGVAAPPVPDSRDPGMIARWWEGLMPAQRTAWVAGDPELIGGLAGVPARWRDQANRLALGQTIERLEGEKEALTARIVELRGLAGHDLAMVGVAAELTGVQRRLDGVARRLDGAVNLRRQLEAVVREPSHRLDARDVYLLGFDADFAGGDGLAVVALGDPGAAEHIGVLVPGTDNTLGNVEGPLRSAAKLRATVDQHIGRDIALRTATVVWLGYDTPQRGLVGGRVPVDSTGKSEAETGATALRGFVDELRATHDGPSRPHVAVFGHSYGSTVVGMAAARGMAADDVVLYASPGAGADHASQLAASPGHVWAARTDDDPIRYGKGLAALDEDPMGAGFGARRVPLDPPPVQSGHSGYYEWDSRGLRNFAHILTGRGGEVR